MKVVINRTWGGFNLSPKAMQRYGELSGFKVYAYTEDFDAKTFKREKIRSHRRGDGDLFVHYSREPLKNGELIKDSALYPDDIERTDPILIRVVEELGEEADTSVSKLKIVEIPDGVEYEIDDYDGMETIHEKHHSWT